MASRKLLIPIAMAAIICFLIIIKLKNQQPAIHETKSIRFIETATSKNHLKNWRGLSKNEIGKLSQLGRILFLEEEPPEVLNPKKYQILVWKYGETIHERHLKQFGTKLIDPFEVCAVKNCELTYNDSALSTADIVIFHMQRMKKGEIPHIRGSESQIWAFLTDESPPEMFNDNTNKFTNYNGVFNWSMTYRMDSDIPVPYGRTILRKKTENRTIAKRKDVLVAAMISHCYANNRLDYIKELKKYIAVDFYGRCGTLDTCPGHYKKDCPAINSYLFYLAFENEKCDEYITEKLWWNAYEKNSIPIVMGATREGYKKLLPPNSYLNIDDFAHPKDLATHILYLNSTGKYREYYEWKRDFEVLNEHAYFQSKSYHYCRVCEALNYNRKNTKIYHDLSQFWDTKRDCHPEWNAELLT